MINIINHAKCFVLIGKRALLNVLAIVPTRRAAAIVPSRTPPQLLRKVKERIREDTTRVQSTDTFIVPNFLPAASLSARDSSSAASGIVPDSTFALTPAATRIIPMRQKSQDSR